MTNLNLYRIFCEVARQKNITKASEKLYISQPAVSAAIKELENSLGGQLFIRENKGVVLTSYGLDIYEKISHSINTLESMEHYFDDIKTMQNGILRIGTNTSNTTQIISEYLIKFTSLYPNIKVKMIRDKKENLIQQLENQQIDIVYVDTDDVESYQIIKQYEIKYQLIGDMNNLKKYEKNPINSSNFPSTEIILPNLANTSREIIDAHLSSNNIIATPKYEVDNYSILFDMVKAGLGIAFVNADYYQNEIGKTVFSLNSELNFLARKITAICSKKSKNPTLEQFIDVILD